MANVNLYHLTKFPLVVYCLLKLYEIRQIHPNSIHKNCFKMFLSAHFSTWISRLPFAVNAMLNVNVKAVRSDSTRVEMHFPFPF